MFFPNMMINFLDESLKSHPGIFNPVGYAKVSQRMVHNLVTIAKEFCNVFISWKSISAYYAGPF